MFIGSLLENVAQGRIVPMPGYKTITSSVLERNFFYEQFLTGMAYLEASGFNTAVERYVKKWFICGRIYVYLRNFQGNVTHLKKSENWRRNLVKCVHQADRLLASDYNVEIKRDTNNVRPISLRQLKACFGVCIICLTISIIFFSSIEIFYCEPNNFIHSCINLFL